MKLIYVFIIAVILKSLVWSIVVPIWQTPDEQAHFAQLAFFVDNKTTHINTSIDLSQEIAITERMLGTNRDNRGNNSFTYHSDYKIPYTNSITGKYEEKSINLPRSTRTTYVGQEAAHYPPLYYVLAAPFYYLGDSASLIDRVYLARILSIILSALLAVVAYKIGKSIWENEVIAISLGVVVSFQPMLSYVFAGIHPDNLLNLLYSFGILLLLLLLKKGINIKYLIALGGIALLGIFTKPLMFPFFPLAGAVFFWVLLKKMPVVRLVLTAAILIAPIFVFVFKINLPYVPIGDQGVLTFVDYLKFRLPKIFFEIWPWTWGVFKWLGVVQSPLTLKIITRLAMLSVLGMALFILKKVRSRKFDFEWQAFWFFLVSVFSFGTYLILWDYRLMAQTGFSQGLQGRYFFPNIVPLMSLFLIGFMAFVPKSWTKFVAIAVAVLMIFLNLISISLLTRIYYSATNLHSLILQISQYKPVIFKGDIILVIYVCFLVSLGFLFVGLAKNAQKNT